MDERSIILKGDPAQSARLASNIGKDTLAGLSDATPIGLIVTTTSGNIIGFNQAIQDMLDIRLEDYVNTNICDLYANPEAREDLLRQLKSSNSVKNFEAEAKHPDGTLRTVLANIDSIEYNGEPVLLASLQDVTQLIKHPEVMKTARSITIRFSTTPRSASP
ncbi:MAG: PAS domain-containing protein [Eubacteriales bacterium]